MLVDAHEQAVYKHLTAARHCRNNPLHPSNWNATNLSGIGHFAGFQS